MTTFDFSFGASGQQPAVRRASDRMRILILADLRGATERPALRARQPRRLDIDNFGTTLRRYAPSVQPGGDANVPALTFHDLEDFEPDALFTGSPAFAALRQGRQDIKAGKLPASAPDPGTENDASTDSKHEAVEDTLTRLLGSAADTPPPRAGGGKLDSFISKLVADDIAPAATDTASALAACDAAIAQAMRTVLHDSALQRIEASWRGLRELVQSVEADDALSIHVLDVSQAELASDLVSGQAGDSALVSRLIDQERGTYGGEPWDYIVADFLLGPEQAELIAALGALARAAGGTLLADAPIHALGDTPAEDWRALCASPAAASVCLATPRVLRRAPYGKQNDAPHSFEFEECPHQPEPEALLWGSAALLVATCVAQAFESGEPGGTLSAQDAANDRPLFTFEHDGTRTLQPATETLLSDNEADALRASWKVMPLRAQRNGNRVLFGRVQTLA